MSACVLLGRGDRWLLSVRGPEVDYAPGSLGLVGGHLDPADTGPDALRAAARREVGEETGIDLTGVTLHYLESSLFDDGAGAQLSVTFVVDETDLAAARPGPGGQVEAAVRAPDELTEVGWWTVTEAAADPRCPDWLPGLLERAARMNPAGLRR